MCECLHLNKKQKWLNSVCATKPLRWLLLRDRRVLFCRRRHNTCQWRERTDISSELHQYGYKFYNLHIQWLQKCEQPAWCRQDLKYYLKYYSTNKKIQVAKSLSDFILNSTMWRYPVEWVTKTASYTRVVKHHDDDDDDDDEDDDDECIFFFIWLQVDIPWSCRVKKFVAKNSFQISSHYFYVKRFLTN